MDGTIVSSLIAAGATGGTVSGLVLLMFRQLHKRIEGLHMQMDKRMDEVRTKELCDERSGNIAKQLDDMRKEICNDLRELKEANGV